MEVRIIMIMFHQLVIALVLPWNQVTGNNVTTVINTNDLTPSLSLPLQLSVSEVISEIQVCATLNTSSINEIDIDVTLATSDGTATNSTDYLGVSMDFIFPAGSISGIQQCINITIIDNTTVEEDETFTVTLSTSNPRVELDNNVTTVTILDNDLENSMLIGFKTLGRPICVSEDDRVVQVCVYLFSRAFYEIEMYITFSTSDGTARDGSGYITNTSTWEDYSGCYKFYCSEVVIIDDLKVERNENFTVTLNTSLISYNNIIPLLSSNVKTVAITDDVEVSVPAVLSVAEDAGSVPVCVTLNTSLTEVFIIVTLATSDGTAKNGSDYTGLSMDLVINSLTVADSIECFHLSPYFQFFSNVTGTGAMQCVDIMISDDLKLETNETFSVILTSSSAVILNNVSTIIITDFDTAEVSVPDELSVAEDEGTVQVCAMLSLSTEVDITVTLAISNGTASDGSDYCGVSKELLFTAGIGNGTTQCIDVAIIDDLLVESNETFIVILTTSTSIVKLGNNWTTVIIKDIDIPSVSIPDKKRVTEDVGIVQVCATLNISSYTTAVNITVTLETKSGTATDIDSNDFTGVSMDLVFTVGSSSDTPPLCIDIVIIDSTSTVEEDETFNVVLTTSSSVVTLGNNVTTVTITNATSNSAAVIGGVIAAIVILIFIAVVIVFVAYRRSIKVKKRRVLVIGSGQSPGSELSHMRVRDIHREKVPKHLIIDSCNLKLNETIGQGEFGIVYKAQLSKGSSTRISGIVAVKTLKGFLDESIVTDLLKECTRMTTLDHPNVLTLIGVCLDGGPAPYIVMPFMFNGSLHSHLKKERNNLVISPDQESDTDNVAVVSIKLIDISLQIAKGMEYLGSKRLIHRDLATRNCMIDVNFVIKVADFGLSEMIDSSKYYFRQDMDGVKLPVKWLAPECLSDGMFSVKTDVWAFGVTCWEIFSGGKTPYPGIKANDLLYMLERGHRMERPSNAACTDEIFNLMTQCWRKNAKTRPTFSDVVTCLSCHLQSHAGYLDVNEEVM